MSDTYTVRMKWNAKKDPARLIVTIPPRFYELSRTERRKALSEVRVSVKAFMDELARVA